VTRPVVLGWVALAVVLAVLWWRQVRTRNATSVDVAWSYGLAGLSAWYALASPASWPVRALTGGLAFLWAIRLGTFLLVNRVLRSQEEDGRYRAMRETWGPSARGKFFLVYQAQAAVAVLFSLPILGAMQAGKLDVLAGVGLGVWMMAVGGEALADRQLSRFRADPTNHGEVCTVGLWRYSRHPNYFFEWIHWWSYVLIGHGAALTWIGPVMMLVFLFRISGIPYTELQALRTRGDRYREYQRTTSAFVPWFPKKRAG
jgi:steroid 5-alpha reductase family enzyme